MSEPQSGGFKDVPQFKQTTPEQARASRKELDDKIAQALAQGKQQSKQPKYDAFGKRIEGSAN